MLVQDDYRALQQEIESKFKLSQTQINQFGIEKRKKRQEMMFNSINTDINNYKSIPYQRQQYVKQHFVKHNTSRNPSKSSYDPSSKLQNRQSPYSKLKVQPSIPFQNKDFYQQNYEVRSPFQQNLKHSHVKSYNSEQYYYGSQSDSHSEKSNQWERNSASYFPTSQMLPTQNQIYSSTNPFKKHTEKKLTYNFDTFSNKSKSRIKQMNEKIDQTTKFILKNGLIHQKQPTNLRSSRSREKITFESPRNLQKLPSRISSERKKYSLIDRKNKFVTQKNLQAQIIRRSEDFLFSKPLIFETNNYQQRVKPQRIIPYVSSIPTNIKSPFQSNRRINIEKKLNQNHEMIGFSNFEDQNAKSQFRQKSYQLPSTYRKDITFNAMNKDQLVFSKRLSETGKQFSNFGSGNSHFDHPVLYTSQSQQTFHKSKRSNSDEQQLRMKQNNLLQLKNYSRSKNKMENISQFQSKNQFQPTDLIVLNRNSSNKKPSEKIPSRQFGNFDKNFHSSRLNYGQDTQIQKQQPFKRTSSFDHNVEFFEFQKNYYTKTNPDFEFKDFEDESSGTYEKFVPSQEKVQNKFAFNEKKIHNKSQTQKTQNIEESRTLREKQDSAQRISPYKRYLSQIKDKESQFIASALIILAVVILIIQLVQ